VRKLFDAARNVTRPELASPSDADYVLQSHCAASASRREAHHSVISVRHDGARPRRTADDEACHPSAAGGVTEEALEPVREKQQPRDVCRGVPDAEARGHGEQWRCAACGRWRRPRWLRRHACVAHTGMRQADCGAGATRCSKARHHGTARTRTDTHAAGHTDTQQSGVEKAGLRAGRGVDRVTFCTGTLQRRRKHTTAAQRRTGEEVLPHF
jgi:hypothetical protein